MANELTINGAIEAVAGDDPTRKSVFRAMEQRDHWILDREGEVMDRLLVELGEMIEQQAFSVPAEADTDALVDMLAMLRSGRFYRLFREIGTSRQAFLDDVVSEIRQAEDDAISPELNVIRSRLLVADQVGYLIDLFSADRSRVLNLAVEDAYADEY